MKNYSVLFVLSFVMIAMMTLYSCSSNESNNQIAEEDFQELTMEENNESSTDLLKGPLLGCAPVIEMHCGYFYVKNTSKSCCPDEMRSYKLEKQSGGFPLVLFSSKCKVKIDYSNMGCGPLDLTISDSSGVLYTYVIDPLGTPTSSYPFCEYC